MVKEPWIGQRSMAAASCRDLLEVILKSGYFLNHRLASCYQLWLVKYRFDKAMRRAGAFLFDDLRASRGVGIVNGDPTLERIAQGNGLALCAAGSWTARFAAVLEQLVAD